MDEGPWAGLGPLGWFLGVWVVMTAAMMFPSVAPTVAPYSTMTGRRSALSPVLLLALGVLVLTTPHLVPALTVPAAGPMNGM